MTTPSNAPEESPDHPDAPGAASGYAVPPVDAATPPAASQYAPVAPQYAPSGPQYPAAGYPPEAAPAPVLARNPLGIAALMIGAVLLVNSLVSLLIQTTMIRGGNFPMISAITAFFSVAQGALAVAAIICGAIALSRKGRVKGAAGVGLGIGIAVLWTVLNGLFYSLGLQYLL